MNCKKKCRLSGSVHLMLRKKYKKEKKVTKKLIKNCHLFYKKPLLYKKRKAMMKKYDSLCARILDMESLVEPQLDLSVLCMQSGISSKDADRIFYKEFGMSGAEIISSIHSARQGRS